MTVKLMMRASRNAIKGLARLAATAMVALLAGHLETSAQVQSAPIAASMPLFSKTW